MDLMVCGADGGGGGDDHHHNNVCRQVVKILSQRCKYSLKFVQQTKFICSLIGDEVAEWLRRWTANPLCSARVGSNPTIINIFFQGAKSLVHANIQLLVLP